MMRWFDLRLALLGRIRLRMASLLAQREYFKRRVGAAGQGDAGGGKECEYDGHHGSTVLTRAVNTLRRCSITSAKPLI
jgi:hypothetical protein